MLTIELYKLKQKNNFEEFYNKISIFIPGLKKFTSSKLKVAENEGLIDKEFYNADGILDEVYMDVFKIFSNEINEKQLRKILFIKTIQKINEKTKTEEQFTNNINIDDILKEELDLLNEDYTIDAGGDFILDEELDDISYKQKSFKPTHFILDQSLEQQIIGKLNLNDMSLSSAEKRNLFGDLFYNIPPKSRVIIELFIFGYQNISEISELLLIGEEKITKVIAKVTDRFKLI